MRTYVRTLEGSDFCLDRPSANCGLVARLSTRAEIGDLFARLEERLWAGSCGFGRLARDFLEFLAHPTDAGDFDLSILADPEGRRHVRQTVGIRDGKALGIVQENRERHPVAAIELGRVILLILRDPHNRELAAIPVDLMNAFEVGEGVLAHRAGNLEESR